MGRYSRWLGIKVHVGGWEGIGYGWEAKMGGKVDEQNVRCVGRYSRWVGGYCRL